jgi:hypothetical protein
MLNKIALVVLLSGICGVASAYESCTVHWDGWWPTLTCTDGDDHKKTITAPEIDPASATGGLIMLLGGLAVLRGRRTKHSRAE